LSQPTKKFKRPESVLVVVYTRTGKVLLLRRAGMQSGGEVGVTDFWQSVTGSLRWDETAPQQAAKRELFEETGLKAITALRDLQLTQRYSILPAWRPRYAPAVQENTEHAFALELPAETLITINPAEHAEYGWFDFGTAMAKVASWSNREAIHKVNTTQT
jgi:dATP pyrophosphohydrolase